MARRDIIVIGASAGGIEALKALTQALPSDFPAAIMVTVHISANAKSFLPQIISRHTQLKVMHTTERQPIEHGHIYIAPPNHHLLVRRGHLRITHGPAENGHRPAIDPMFRTAALAYGPRVIGIILSGLLYDGTAGAIEINRYHGLCIAQDPSEAIYASMPEHVIEHDDVDYIVPMAEMPPLLQRLVQETVDDQPPQPDGDADSDPAEGETTDAEVRTLEGPPSGLTCPTCGGSLWEERVEELTHFRCRVGHTFSEPYLLEQALWAAIRALEENAALIKRLRDRSMKAGKKLAAGNFSRRLDDVERNIIVIRRALVNLHDTDNVDPTATMPFESDSDESLD